MENMEKLYRQVSNLSLLKKSGTIAAIVTFALLGAWFGFSRLSLGAYNEKNLTKQFLAEDSEVFKTIVIEVGSDTVGRIIVGTTSMTLTGTSSYPWQPRIQYSGATGLWTFKNSGGTATTAFGTVTADYVAAEIGSVTAKYVLQNNGSSTGQTVTNPTLAGVGTSTATIRANGLDITPAEYASVNNATGELQAQITETKGSVTNHVHSGSDGTVKISHTDLTSATKGTQTHPQIDTFIAKEGQANGLATTNASNLVVQNPASASKTPGTSTIVMTGTNTDKIADAYLSDNITKLGTPTTNNISEGSTNKYYTDGRVNAAVGSLSVNTHNDVNITDWTEGYTLKIASGQVVSGSSTASVGWDGITGEPAGNPYVREVSGTATIVLRDSSGNAHLQGSIVGSETVTNLNPTRINFAGTTTAITGTQTIPVWYTLKETKTSASGIHSNPDVLLYVAADSGGSSTTFIDTSSYQATLTTGGNAVSSSAWSEFGGASYYGTNGNLAVGTSTSGRYNIFGTDTCYMSLFIKLNNLSATQQFFGIGETRIGWWFGSTLGLGIRIDGANSFFQGDNSGWSAGVKYHVGVRKLSGGGYQLLRDGVVVASGTNSTAWDTGGNPIIGNGFDAPIQGFMDDFYWEKNTTGTSTVPTAAFAGTSTIYYTRYSSYYIPANASTPFFTIIDDGTNSVKPQIIIGSTTSTATSTTGIKLEVSGKVYATSYLSPSEEKKKVVYPERTVNYLDELKNIRVGEWSWKKNDVNRLDAEAKAKKNYIQDKKKSWVDANKSNYLSTVLEPGTGTVTKVDTVKMDKDYQTHSELEWASEPEQYELINEVENKLMAGESPDIHMTAFAGDPTTPAIMQSKSKTELCLNDQIGWSIKVMQAQQKEIGSLTAALENLKVMNNLK